MQICWQLFQYSLDASHICFYNITVDGVAKTSSQGPGMWSILTACCAEAETPSTTVQFDFVWCVSRPAGRDARAPAAQPDAHSLMAGHARPGTAQRSAAEPHCLPRAAP